MPDDPERSDAGVQRPKRNHLISRKKFREFVEDHPGAAQDSDVFLRWCKVVEQALWTDFSDVRETFSTASHVGDRVVFNVGGGKYRVVAQIDYQFAKVVIRHVLTHAEYDKEAWKTGP